MRIDCEQCGAAYSIDDALIGDRGVRAQCPKCGHQKVVKKAAAGGPAPITAVSNVPPSLTSSQNPFQAGAPSGPFGAPSGASSNPFAGPSNAPPSSKADVTVMNPFVPQSSEPTQQTQNPFATATQQNTSSNPFGAPVSSSPPTAPSGPPMGNPFAPPPSMGAPSMSAPPMGAPPMGSMPPQGSGNPFGGPSTSSNPFGAPVPQAPSASSNPFAPPPSMGPPPGGNGNPFGAPNAGAAASPFGAPSGGAASSPFGPPGSMIGGANPGTTPGARSPFAPPSTSSGDPFGASASAAPRNGAGGGGDPFAAALGAPTADPFAALAPPAPAAGPPSMPPQPAIDPFVKLGQAPARPALALGGLAQATASAAARPPEPQGGGGADPFAAFGAGGGAAADPFARPQVRTNAGAAPNASSPPTGAGAVVDPFAKLDMGPSSSDARASETPATQRWRVRTKAGLDADVDLPQLRDMVKTGKVALDDEAGPAGDAALKPVGSWPILVPVKPASQRSRGVTGANVRSGPSFKVIAAAVGVIGLVAVVAGVYIAKPELFERRTEAGVNPLRRAKPSWEKQFPEVNGTASEHLANGKAQMRLDTAAGYRKADDELRQALLLDISNTTSIALWVENFTSLPAVRADLESTNLAQEAIAYAKKKDPANVDVLRADGALKLALGDVDAAQKVLTQAHATAGAGADTTLVLAESHVERSPDEALALVQEARAKDPQLKHALVVEGAAQRRLGAFKEARDVLGSRLVDDPANTGALKEMAKLELDLGNSEAAIQALTKLLGAEDRDVEAHLMRAKIAYQATETPDGLKRADGYLDSVLKNHDTTAGELLLPVLAHAAYVKAELGDLESASKLAERARATDPNYAPGLFVLGRVYTLKGKLDDAKKMFEQALRATQAHASDQFYDPVIRAELARVLTQSGDPANAIRNYEQVIEYDPRYTRAHFGLASTYLATDRATQAMTIMRRAYDNDPAYEAERKVLTDYPTPKRDLLAFADVFKNAKIPAGDESLAALKLASEAMIRYQAGQIAEAESLAKKTLVEDRFNDVALLLLGVIELGDGRNQDALKHLKLASETTAKNHAMTRLYLVRAEMKTGNLADAKKQVQDLVDQEPTLVQAQYTKAMVARADHLEAQAMEELKKVLKADQDYTPAKRALAD